MLHSAVCNDTYVESTGECRRDGTADRMVRSVVMMSSERKGCECQSPTAKILTTACDCVDVETGDLRQEAENFIEHEPCDAQCTQGMAQCGTSVCQRKTRWYRMVYVAGGAPPKCRKELIRETIADCCKLPI